MSKTVRNLSDPYTSTRGKDPAITNTVDLELMAMLTTVWLISMTGSTQKEKAMWIRQFVSGV